MPGESDLARGSKTTGCHGAGQGYAALMSFIPPLPNYLPDNHWQNRIAYGLWLAARHTEQLADNLCNEAQKLNLEKQRSKIRDLYNQSFTMRRHATFLFTQAQQIENEQRAAQADHRIRKMGVWGVA